MQRLDLDFCGTRRASPWAGRLLLAVAAGLCVDMGLTYQGLQKSIGEGEVRVAKAALRAPPRKPPAEEVAAARDTVQRLATPWTRLFGALESAATAEVALLAIEPNPRGGTVIISGDSKDYLAALTYVLNLSRDDALSSVQLVRHEVKPHAVGFSVSAAWTEAKR